MQKISRPNAVQHQNLVILGQKISWPNKAQPHVKRKTGEKLKARFAKKLEIVCMNISKLGSTLEERNLASTNPPTTPKKTQPPPHTNPSTPTCLEATQMAEFAVEEILLFSLVEAKA